MSVGGVSHLSMKGALSSGMIDGTSGFGGSRRAQAVIESVSQLFGMSPEALRHELASGRTMMDIAADKGISSMDLLKTIKAAMLLASAKTEHGFTDEKMKHASSEVANKVGMAGGLDTRA